MELFVVIFRTIFFYLFIVFIFRLMGKREVGQLSIQDLVVSILIAELVAISIENIDDSLMRTIIPIGILVFLEISASIIALKSRKFRNIIEGKPSLIINKGKINFKELVKQRYTLDDLLLGLRNNKIKSLEDVEYAVLETNGKLSIFKYNFLRMSSNNPLPLILDGVVQSEVIKYLGKDELWLKNMLIKENVSLNNVFYCFYKDSKPYIIRKNNLI